MYAVWYYYENRLHFIQRHRTRRPERRTLLGRCLHAPPCTSLRFRAHRPRAPPLQTQRRPGRRPAIHAPKRRPRRVSCPYALRWASSGHPPTKSTSLEPPRRVPRRASRRSKPLGAQTSCNRNRLEPKQVVIETASQTSWRKGPSIGKGPKHRERPNLGESLGEFGRVWESLGEFGRGLIWRTSPSSSLASSWAGAL